MNRVAAATFFVPLLFALSLLVWKRADTEDQLPLVSMPPKAVTAPLVSAPREATDQTIFGVASVGDGDSLEIHGIKIRLNGIDAPESGQTCMSSGKKYRCGQKAALFLQETIGRKQVSCEPLGRDRYDRILARCAVGDTDLGSVMVSNGWALAYRQYDMVYVPLEEQASEAQLGIWSGEFIAPWLWRKGERMEGEQHGG